RCVPNGFPARDLIREVLRVRYRFLERLNPRMIAAAEQRDASVRQLLEQRLEGGSRRGVHPRPAFGLEHDQPLRLRCGWRRCRTEKPRPARIAARTSRYLDRDLPHVL